MADWGGHPFLYEIDLFDENGGPASTTQHVANQGPSTNVDQAMPVTAGELAARAPEHRGRVRDDRPDRHDLVALTPRPRRSPA